MINSIDPLSVVAIDIPQTQQGEELAQQNGLYNRITTMQIAQKGLLLSLGLCSICTASAAIAVFFTPDPPPNSLLPSFISTAVVAKNTQKWSLSIISAATAVASILCTKYFLQKNQQQVESTITPEIASIIKNSVEKEIKNANPGSSRLPT